VKVRPALSDDLSPFEACSEQTELEPSCVAQPNRGSMAADELRPHTAHPPRSSARFRATRARAVRRPGNRRGQSQRVHKTSAPRAACGAALVQVTASRRSASGALRAARPLRLAARDEGDRPQCVLGGPGVAFRQDAPVQGARLLSERPADRQPRTPGCARCADFRRGRGGRHGDGGRAASAHGDRKQGGAEGVVARFPTDPPALHFTCMASSARPERLFRNTRTGIPEHEGTYVTLPFTPSSH
jgi:hypothetical protein